MSFLFKPLFVGFEGKPQGPPSSSGAMRMVTNSSLIGARDERGERSAIASVCLKLSSLSSSNEVSTICNMSVSVGLGTPILVGIQRTPKGGHTFRGPLFGELNLGWVMFRRIV